MSESSQVTSSSQQIKEVLNNVINSDSSSGTDDDESVLSEIDDESKYFAEKLTFQRRALMRKNITLQWKQKWTNIWQFLAPIMGLIIVATIREVGRLGILSIGDRVINVPFPQVFGLNFRALGTIMNFISVIRCNKWFMYEFEKSVSQEDRAFFGWNDGSPWNKVNYSGMLNGQNIFTSPCNEVNRTVPYFQEFTIDKYQGREDMSEYLGKQLKLYSNLDIDFTRPQNFHPEIENLPDGAYLIKESNKKKLKYNLQINDQKYWQYHRNNGITLIAVKEPGKEHNYYKLQTVEGSLHVTDTINQAYMRHLFNDTIVIGGVQFFPFTPNLEAQMQSILATIMMMIFPICLSMGLPVFIYQIVLEKETRLMEYMKMNGLRMHNYWFVNFFFNLGFYMMTVLVFIFAGYQIFEIDFFKKTSMFILLIVMFGWGLAQISMAFLISIFLSKSQTAQIIGYSVGIWLTTMASVMNMTLFSNSYMDGILYPLPTFSFTRLIYFMAASCRSGKCIAEWSDIDPEMIWCTFMLYLFAGIYIILSIYLYQIVPQSYGVPKKWNYLCKRDKKKQKIDEGLIGSSGIEEDPDSPIIDFDQTLEDTDSKAEREYVYNLDPEDYSKYPLIIKDMRKVYPACGGVPPKVATKCFSLRIKKGEMFGMLGPNGAGKTTLISMLTGLYSPTNGNAWVAGYDIKNQLELVQLQIGVCPQFDLLWSDLTVEEHLLFYARLKGVLPENEKEMVNQAINDVLLNKFRHFKTSSLSGGMKRRLSVAISLVSDPKIVYLDEPSTGLDPENRRQLWDILSAQKGKRAVILTTHSMEEADVLCNRIGIVSQGILRCVAPQVRLKSIYGGGYHLFINCQKGMALQLLRRQKRMDARAKLGKDSDDSKSPDNENEDDEFSEAADSEHINDVEVPVEGFKAKDFYHLIEKNRERLRITDWGVSQCSLEDVFQRIYNKMSALNDDNQVSNNHLHTTINQQFTINERSSIHYHDDDDGNVDQEGHGSEDSSESDESVLSEIQNEYIYFEKKFLYQKRALLRKNITLQWRQKGTNVCQILSPILGLLIIVIFKELGIQGLLQFQDRPVFVPFPQVFGMNMKAISSLAKGYIDISSCNQWYIYQFDSKINRQDREFFGNNDGLPWIKPQSQGMINGRTNVLSYTCDDVNRTVPYFEEYSPEKYPQSHDVFEYLSKTLDSYAGISISMNDKNPYFQEQDKLPDGTFYIRESNKRRLRYNMQINDSKRWQYHRNNGITKIGVTDRETNTTLYSIRTIDGALTVADIINQAYMRELFNDTTVVGGVQFMPFLSDVINNVQKVVSLAGILVLPLCMSMGLPVFLYQIVLEKENRLIENMKINGMRMSNYWIVNFFFNLGFYCVTALLFMLFGTKVFGLQVFVETDPFIFMLVLFGWGLAQISTAFLLSVFLNKSQSATIVGYLFAVWMTTVATTLNMSIYSRPHKMDWFFFPIPAFAFCRVMYFIARNCGYSHCVRSFNDFNDEMQGGIIMLYVSSAIFMVLALYLYQVVPQTYGTHKKWDYLCRKKGKTIDDESEEEPVYQFDQSLEDADSKAERNIVYNLDKEDYYKYPLIIKDLHKIYPSMGGIPPKVATKSFCLRIKKGEIFGMLGPNGAGKTTLISMLTGMYRPTSGNAWVAGNDIRTQLQEVQLQIGLCPQFDLLWGDLTVEEHLLFFARLKGIEPDEEYEKVQVAMDEVLLTKFKDFQVKALSGGMKRRLSVAISLVSEPKIIFLDEPSTGLDPENRRQLWDILSAQKGKKAMILTTHSMEEADVLCGRIGIVSNGVLRCVAPQVRLKSIYGGGYHLFINCQRSKVLSLQKAIKQKQKQEEEKKIIDGHLDLSPSNEERDNDDDLDITTVIKRITDFIRKEVPLAKLIREFNGNFTYQIPIQDFKAEKFYYAMERNRQRLRITDWGISQCSLEDVFSQICESK